MPTLIHFSTELEGMPRVREILEANEWSSLDDGDEEGHENLLEDTHDEDGLDLEAHELEKEMLGLRMAVDSGRDDPTADDDLDDDQLETLMMRVQAIRGKQIILA